MPTTREKSAEIKKQTTAFRQSGGKIKKVKRGATGMPTTQTMKKNIKAKVTAITSWHKRLMDSMDKINGIDGALNDNQMALKLNIAGIKTKMKSDFTGCSVARAKKEMNYVYAA